MNRSSGFTLIELMLTIAVLGIVSAFALPSFNQFIENNRNRQMGRELFGSLNYARAIAASRQKTIALCASSDGATCNAGSDWKYGGIVFQDDNRNGKRDAGEELLQRVAAAPDNSTLSLHSLQSHLRYKPDGRLAWTGNFQYCPPSREETSGWIIVFHLTGRPYFGRDSDGDGAAETGRGDNLDCS